MNKIILTILAIILLVVTPIATAQQDISPDNIHINPSSEANYSTQNETQTPINNQSLISFFTDIQSICDFSDINQTNSFNCITELNLLLNVSEEKCKPKNFQENLCWVEIGTYYFEYEFVSLTNETGTFNYTYVYNDNVLVAKINPDGSKWFYHADHLGSTTLITNESGSIVEETFYMPYGRLLDGGTKEIKLYEGKELDETGTYYFNARYYSPSMRMFTQPDSIIPDIYDPQQLNIYAFERGNPLRYVDETGNVPVDTFLDVTFVAQGTLNFLDDPSLSTFGELAVDVAFVAIPYVPNVKRIAEGVSALSKGGKAIRAADKAGDAGKILKETGEVAVDSFKEANTLLKNAFPGITKVPGAGPKMTKASGSLFKGTNVFRKDYLFNPNTGRIYGHGEKNLHATKPHINIKSGKKKFTIVINKAKDFIS